MSPEIRKVLIPYEVGIRDISGGVGTPNVVYDVRRGIYYLLFTGWSDPVGLKREAFIVEVDRDFNIRWDTLKKILSRDFPEPVNYSHSVVRGVYNPVLDEFIVTSSHENRVYIYKIYISLILSGGSRSIECSSNTPLQGTSAPRSSRLEPTGGCTTRSR